ncbi:Hypothetical protein Cp262_0582 [Corynebacterium pseudotuberculosis]|nr:Hypothetical protein Cp262_0582 [Corynebacterium pseudotuberculosis]
MIAFVVLSVCSVAPCYWQRTKEKFVAIKALFCAVVLRSTAGVKLNRCLHHLLYLGTFLRGLHSERRGWLWM